MAEQNGNNNSSRSSNDISEMLRMLRESVDRDRNSQDDGARERDVAVDDLNNEIKLSLEKVFEETSLYKTISELEDDDVELDDEVDDESSWFAIDEDTDDEPAEEDPESDDPWYSDDEPEKTEESAEEEIVEEA